MTTIATSLMEIRWHGRAGQGIVTASKLLAESALTEGKHFQAFPEYGPERMGAPIQAFTRIDEKPIRVHGNIVHPQIVIIFDETLMSIINVLEGLEKGGIVIVNTTSTPTEMRHKLGEGDYQLYTVDATGIAKDTIGRPIPNIPILSATIRATAIVEFDNFIGHLRTSMSKKFPENIVNGNVEAANRAFIEVKS